jgi:hypothetical protein
MIELILKRYLDNALDVPVLFEHKTGTDVPFVIVEKTGGSSDNHLQKATIAIQSYAASLYNAALLNDKVTQAMDKFDEIENVAGVHLNSSYNYTDTETKNYRYQAVFDINYLQEV